MKFKLEIECDNAAFGDEPSYEVSRILMVIAAKLRREAIDEQTYIHLVDANGNGVGTAQFVGG